MHDVTVGVKAFLRLTELDTALTSLHDHDFHEVIVADDSKMSPARYELYDMHRRYLPLKVLELPFRSGISYGRNRMVESCSTEYFLLMDDDMALTGPIDPMRSVLQANPCIGGVTALLEEDGVMLSGCLNLHCFNRCVVLDAGSARHRITHMADNGIRYFLYDMISNFTLFRTATFKDVKWDEFYLTNHEHTDFYLTHKRLAKWQFALTPDYAVKHEHIANSPESDEYLSFRRDPALLADTVAYFKSKWQLPDGMVFGLPHLPTKFSLAANLNHLKLLLNGIITFYR